MAGTVISVAVELRGLKCNLTFRLVLRNDLDHITAALEHGRRLVMSSIPQVNVVHLYCNHRFTRLTEFSHNNGNKRLGNFISSFQVLHNPGRKVLHYFILYFFTELEKSQNRISALLQRLNFGGCTIVCQLLTAPIPRLNLNFYLYRAAWNASAD